jgi:hypothetical protein
MNARNELPIQPDTVTTQRQLCGPKRSPRRRQKSYSKAVALI